MTYPNGRVINYNYADGINTAIGRLSSVSDSTDTLQSYGYQGLSTVLQDTDGNGIQLNVTQDAFGRTADQNWTNSSSVSVNDTTYTYDCDGNVLTQGDPLATSLSDTHTYDNLNCLTDDTGGGSDHQNWNLDVLRNSSNVTTDGTAKAEAPTTKNNCLPWASARLPVRTLPLYFFTACWRTTARIVDLIKAGIVCQLVTISANSGSMAALFAAPCGDSSIFSAISANVRPPSWAIIVFLAAASRCSHSLIA